MAELTLSPIPFNGGTLSPASNRSIFRLSGDKYVMLYHQTNPDHIIAQVAEITGIKTAAPTVNVLRTQVINNVGPVTWTGLSVRGAKLNDDDFLLLAETPGTNGVKGWAVRVDPVTNVVSVVSTNTVTFTRVSTGSNHGNGLWYGSLNVAIEVSLTSWNGSNSIASQFQVGRVIFNPTSGALTRTVLSTFDTTTAGVWSASSMSRDNTSGYLTLSLGCSGTAVNYGGAYTREIDPVLGTIISSSDAASGTKPVNGLVFVQTPTAKLGFVSLNSYRIQSGTTVATIGDVISFSSVSSGAASCVHADWLTNNYILVEGLTSSNRTTAGTTVGRQFRVVKYIADNHLQATDGTNASNLTLFNSAGNFLQFNNSTNREMYDESTVLLYGISNNTCAVYVLRA